MNTMSLATLIANNHYSATIIDSTDVLVIAGARQLEVDIDKLNAAERAAFGELRTWVNMPSEQCDGLSPSLCTLSW